MKIQTFSDQRSDQAQMVDILPKLHAQLKTGTVENDALGTFQVPWAHVAMHNQMLDSELEKYLIRVCLKAADGLEQCYSTGYTVYPSVYHI